MYNGFIETTDKKFIEKHAEEIWNIMQRSYANIGRFKTFSSIEEMLLRVTLLRYGLNNEGNIICAAIYDNKKGGEKLVGCGTLHNTQDEKNILYNIVLNDTINFSQWHWAEVSGAMERIFQKAGGNPIPSELASDILTKPSHYFKLDDDSHYYRLINNVWHRKIIYGFKDALVYNTVMDNFSQLTGFTAYKEWKEYTNTKKVIKLFEWEKDNTYSRVKFCLNICDRFIDLWDDEGIREIPQTYYDFISSIYEEIVNNYMNKRSVKLRSGLLRTTKLILSWMKIIPEGNMREVAHKIAMPILGK